ncbi:glycoside hydrolase family 10 protein [Pedobacter gandavensis]|uniref:Glycosyl hydrolase-like 10 domain-containing protein n=1 Tax=Pedobacter gandavensis TaxID=2679963 RepID=A0ABR6EQB1_9SPHI|nr:hypothetical protein [Pedobacter gandavensis]MBB2147430.1 hypothetical protein [Pedobacter gandavensis]
MKFNINIKKLSRLGFFLISISLIAVLSSAEQADYKPRTPKFRIIHNNDGTDALANMWFNRKPDLTRADINNYVDLVAESKVVTTFMMCTGSDFVFYRSKYERPFGDDLNDSLDCKGSESERKAFKQYFKNFKSLEAEGTDIIDASLTRAKQRGMEAFITFRVNDLHFADTATHCRVSYPDFWFNNPQYWIGEDNQGMNSSRALDFTHQAVRDHKLALIREQLEKYEMIDGFDLDFMRFIVLFKAGEGSSKAHLMTSFVKSVKLMVDSVSKVRGKKILLSVRVPITVEGALWKGLDVKEWVKQDLIDFISIGAHWRGETATPIAKFKQDLFGKSNKRIPVYGSIDDGGYLPRELYSDGMFKGMASHILGQGGDGLYLFNFYFANYGKVDYQKALNPSGLVCRTRSTRLLNELGSIDKLNTANKIFCASDGVTNSYGVLQVSDLPMACGVGKKSTAFIFIGDPIDKTYPKESILFLRTDRSARMEIEVNGLKITAVQAKYPEDYDRNRGLQEGEKMIAYVLPKNCLIKGENKVSIVARTPNVFVVKRLEVALNYGEVAVNGYF